MCTLYNQPYSQMMLVDCYQPIEEKKEIDIHQQGILQIYLYPPRHVQSYSENLHVVIRGGRELDQIF